MSLGLILRLTAFVWKGLVSILDRRLPRDQSHSRFIDARYLFATF
jgi:hypothetical protein